MTMSIKHVHLGYEVGTGVPIELPLRNLAVTGQTQESGKTTTLEALVTRANVPAIAFVTKRGEGAFHIGQRVQPYFRERADWQFVSSLIDATLQEKNKFLRSWIMKICKTTKTLKEVQRNVQLALKKATGISEGVYTQLDAYLDLIIPEIDRTPLAKTLELRPGLNVMDVSSYPTPMQMLFVQSAIDWVNHHATNTITIVPEAWEFIPEGKGSPVKASAVELTRKGSGIGNYIWIDSQDMAGVDKVILRGCPVWIIGVQREANEIKRNLSNIPAGIRKPNAAAIAGLDRGQFYACWKDRTVKVYVQPSWMDEAAAVRVSLGGSIPPAPVPPKQAPTKMYNALHKTEDEVSPEEANRLRNDNARLLAENADLERRIQALERKPRTSAPTPAVASSNTPVDGLDLEGIYEQFKARLVKEAPAILRVITVKPELEVRVQRRTVEANGDTLRGRIALLIANGFFDGARAGTAIEAELRRQGFACSRPNCYREADKLAADGFFTKEDGGYQAVDGMKVNITQE